LYAHRLSNFPAAVKNFREVVLLVLILSSQIFTPGVAQDIQEAFESELVEASYEKNIPQIQSLIKEHRLWVKPVVDYQISKYIQESSAGNNNSASDERKSAGLIAQTFQDTYGEKSLVIAVEYLERWNLNDLRVKHRADSISNLGTNLRITGEHNEQAIETYLDALELYRDIEDGRGESVVLGGLGYLYFNRDIDTCLSYYQAALEARQRVDDKQLTASSLNGIGQVHFYFLPDSEETLDYFIRAAEIREEIGDWAALGNSHTLAAWTCEDRGELEKAIEHYDQSFNAYRNAGDSVRMANSRINTAMILKLQGLYPEALAVLEEAYEISFEARDTRGLGDALMQMANVYSILGDYNTAVEKCTEALPVFEEVNDTWGIAGVYNNLGITLQNAGRIERAASFYEKALSIYDTLNEQEDVLVVVINLGTIEFDRKNYLKAEEYHKRGLKISRNMDAPSEEMICLLNLANDQNRLGKLEDALSNYEAALELANSLNSPEIIWKILVGKGENYQLRGDYPRAIEYNELGLSGIDEIRESLPQDEYRTSYMARERVAYEDVIHMLGELHEEDHTKGYDLLAFQYTQRCKSRTFLDLLTQKSYNESEGPSNQKLTTATLFDLQSSLKDKNTVVLEYSLGDSSSYVWVITKKKHQLIKLPARNNLREQVETLRFALMNPQQDNQEFFLKSGLNLYNLLMRPAEKHLSKKSKLIILPDGILHYLPFEVLITQEIANQTGVNYGDLPYLVKNYPLSYGHSSSVILNLQTKPYYSNHPDQGGETLLAFGDPVYGNDEADQTTLRNEFSRLVYSGEEIKMIASLFPVNFSEVFLRERALKKNFQEHPALQKYNYIHFATHGIVDEVNPENSSLVLTKEANSSDDGLLKAAEIHNLQLDADLVVLSACQSGLGKLVRGEGIIGLTRAFMYAGTPSVLASLWNVSDASTTILMQRFYENLIQKKLSKTDALRQAQISMIMEGQYSHPFFWAPFVLIGDWN